MRCSKRASTSSARVPSIGNSTPSFILCLVKFRMRALLCRSARSTVCWRVSGSDSWAASVGGMTKHAANSGMQWSHRVSFITQCFSWLKFGRPAGRQVSKNDSGYARNSERRNDGQTGNRNNYAFGQERADDDGNADRNRDAQDRASPNDDQSIKQKLVKNYPASCVHRRPDSDLARSFSDSDQHDVHDSDAANDQGY